MDIRVKSECELTINGIVTIHTERFNFFLGWTTKFNANDSVY